MEGREQFRGVVAFMYVSRWMKKVGLARGRIQIEKAWSPT